MTSEWKPEQYTDEYHKALEQMIEEKVEHGSEKPPVETKKKKPTNVVDSVCVLQRSLTNHRLNRSQKIHQKRRRERLAGENGLQLSFTMAMN